MFHWSIVFALVTMVLLFIGLIITSIIPNVSDVHGILLLPFLGLTGALVTYIIAHIGKNGVQ